MTRTAAPAPAPRLGLTRPRPGGNEFRRAQLGDPTVVSVPVAVMSGATDLEQRAQATDAVATLSRPLDVDGLIEVVKRYCASRLLSAAADGLADGRREDGAERRGGHHQRRHRMLVERIEEHDADQRADRDGRKSIPDAMQPATGALVILGERPKAFRTGGHFFTTVTHGPAGTPRRAAVNQRRRAEPERRFYASLHAPGWRVQRRRRRS